MAAVSGMQQEAAVLLIKVFGITLQPFIIIIGPSINEIAHFYAYIDNTFGLLNCIIAAIDCCFKVKLAQNKFRISVRMLTSLEICTKRFF